MSGEPMRRNGTHAASRALLLVLLLDAPSVQAAPPTMYCARTAIATTIPAEKPPPQTNCQQYYRRGWFRRR